MNFDYDDEELKDGKSRKDSGSQYGNDDEKGDKNQTTSNSSSSNSNSNSNGSTNTRSAAERFTDQQGAASAPYNQQRELEQAASENRMRRDREIAKDLAMSENQDGLGNPVRSDRSDSEHLSHQRCSSCGLLKQYCDCTKNYMCKFNYCLIIVL